MKQLLTQLWSTIRDLYSGLSGKEKLFFLISLFTLGLSGFLTYTMFSPNKVLEVSTKNGAFSIKVGSIQNAIFLLNPAGEEDSPWVSTGIQVKKGDKLKTSATGKIHLSLKWLNFSILFPHEHQLARKDPGWEWVDPEGIPEKKSAQTPRSRNEFKILKDQRYGKLLLAVKDNEKRILEPKAIGSKQDEISINHDGEIVLTVNDVWLVDNEKGKEAYVPPKSNSDYYLHEAWMFATMKGEDFSKWSPAIESQKREEQYKKREKDWKAIYNDNKWNAWYEDNVGSFSVSITVNSQ